MICKLQSQQHYKSYNEWCNTQTMKPQNCMYSTKCMYNIVNDDIKKVQPCTSNWAQTHGSIISPAKRISHRDPQSNKQLIGG